MVVRRNAAHLNALDVDSIFILFVVSYSESLELMFSFVLRAVERKDVEEKLSGRGSIFYGA